MDAEIKKVKELILSYFSKKYDCDNDSVILKEVSDKIQNLDIEGLTNEEFVSYFTSRDTQNRFIPSGFYDPRYKKVVLRSAVSLSSFKPLETAVHEIVHGLSHVLPYKLGLLYSGKGQAFNEMATCYITSKIIGRGYGGSYAEDYREVFKFFMLTTKMDDVELLDIFFGKEHWITDDLSNRFDSQHPNALAELVSLYDKRTTKEFDKKRLFEILKSSAKANEIEKEKSCTQIFDSLSDYFDMDIGK